MAGSNTTFVNSLDFSQPQGTDKQGEFDVGNTPAFLVLLLPLTVCYFQNASSKNYKLSPGPSNSCRVASLYPRTKAPMVRVKEENFVAVEMDAFGLKLSLAVMEARASLSGI